MLNLSILTATAHAITDDNPFKSRKLEICANLTCFQAGERDVHQAAEFYLLDQEVLCFYDIMIRGRQRQEIVIGYRTANAECAIINPPQKSEPRKWAMDDVFVVISSGERNA